MSSKYNVFENSTPHFITATVIHWIDALSRPRYKDILLASIGFYQQNKGLQLHAWEIRNNLVHFIVSTCCLSNDDCRKLSPYSRERYANARPQRFHH